MRRGRRHDENKVGALDIRRGGTDRVHAAPRLPDDHAAIVVPQVLWHRAVVDPEVHVRDRRLELRRPHDRQAARLHDGRVPVRRDGLALSCDHPAEQALQLPEPQSIRVALAPGEALMAHVDHAARVLSAVQLQLAIDEQVLVRAQRRLLKKVGHADQVHRVQLRRAGLDHAFRAACGATEEEFVATRVPHGEARGRPVWPARVAEHGKLRPALAWADWIECRRGFRGDSQTTRRSPTPDGAPGIASVHR
eukprot:scaffold34159_cov58-Phaeocystis_antarctica.AAC.2